jgi:hypothetical protein
MRRWSRGPRHDTSASAKINLLDIAVWRRGPAAVILAVFLLWLYYLLAEEFF